MPTRRPACSTDAPQPPDLDTLDYRAPAWLPGAHAQTIWPALFAPRPRVAFRRETWPAPDGDEVEIDFTDVPVPAGRPWLVLFHGLEGSSRSHYAATLMDEARRRGWQGAVAHFRGCGGRPNLLPRAYHSGDSDEIDWVLRRMRERAGGAPLVAAGVSLGGNALLKWLGERGTDAGFVTAAAGVCAPQDLEAGARSLARGFNRVYTRNFLFSLKRRSLDLLERHPGLLDAERIRAARDFFDFDGAVTAPLHGFRDAVDYWTRSSCRQFLPGIAVPTLVLNARNDPFVPAPVLAGPKQVSRAVTLHYPDEGGHVGFPTGAPPARLDWLPRRLFHFFGEHLHG